MTFKDLSQSLIDAVKAVQKQSYDTTYKDAAVAAIKKNLEQGAITPEIAQAQLHTWGETFTGFRPIPNDGPRQTTPHAPIALTAAYSKTGKAGGPLAMTGGPSSTPNFRRVDKLRSLDKKQPLIGHRKIGESAKEETIDEGYGPARAEIAKHLFAKWKKDDVFDNQDVKSHTELEGQDKKDFVQHVRQIHGFAQKNQITDMKQAVTDYHTKRYGKSHLRMQGMKEEMLNALALPLLPRVIPSDPQQFDQFAEELTQDVMEAKIDWKHPAKAGKENRPKSGKIHPMGVHVKDSTTYFDRIKGRAYGPYHVVAVGEKVRGIKVGEKLTDTELDDASELGHKIKYVGHTKEGTSVMDHVEETEINELSKKTLGSYVGKAVSNQISNATKYARRQWGDKKYEPGARQAKVDLSVKMARRGVGISNALNRLTKEETIDEASKAHQAEKGKKYAVLSQQHPIDDPDNVSGPIHFHGHKLTYEKAHKVARKVHETEFLKYPKGYGYYSDNMGNKDNYHIVATHSEQGKHKPAHSVHVVKMHNMKECSFDGKVFNVLDEVKVDRELGHTLLKKWKDMTASERARVNQLLKKPEPKVKKEEVEADQNILVHLRKTIDTEGKHETEFLTGEKLAIPEEVAVAVLNHMLRLKPEVRGQVQQYLQQSIENVFEVYELIESKNPAAACPACGGWTSSGGMSQHSKSKTPVLGRAGCTCNTGKKVDLSKHHWSQKYKSRFGGW